ncbi:MAG TPA: DMT family transporter [Devosiaceae bacterium]|jgi:drug/metabolite transporter (DMT)-like permease|nr:DMT family transporter [Devosiaceae bacterium]
MSSPVAPLQDRRLRGIVFVLAGYFCFTVIDSCAKWLTIAGMPTGEVVFVRYAGQLLFVVLLLGPRSGADMLRTRRPWLEVVRGVCLLASTAANFLALSFLPLTVTSSINFTMPLVLCALSIPLLGEQVGWRRWLAIGIGFIGILVIVRPGTQAFHPAVLLSLTNVVFVASYMILNRKLAGVDSATTQQFYAGLVATVCVAGFAIHGWTWPVDRVGWFCFVLIGVAALVAHQFITIAHRYAPASVLAPFAYLQIVSMTASSWLIFNQPPDVWIFVGVPIVIGSGLYIWLRERALQKGAVTEVAPQD